mmetsp:Transcript_131692/g.196240  ORF Transcript_131692/g.196240 Transcript_131692/m.196240 type:complete len:137 (+) Transcript_131692:25-435(+)|eukprot:CAMPEP_0117046208 /NCGR_PEP_ID=MMETSP0472-20121206/31956_1 /TAXON_ID=693140 ORGANISM="Tiarina fusus, Strain LIS" /NCGR_SAMPLE_ID=MMETSP0472 /ASSEMBLY_ACC=CAM_ASM_000603 /LENGTH=136 /DNA_ID=CAMNT_0004758483 /DNA_START=22 /DNA_END=432 /DNA_ORIENTATION=+
MTIQVKALNRKRKVVKKHTKFERWQASNFMRVPSSWRKPKGIDGRQRRRFKGLPKMPKIGYGTEKTMRHVLPNGFIKFTVHNAKDVDLLLMLNRKFCAEIAHSVGTTKRKAIVRRCAELNVRVTNGAAKLEEEEDE